jgi:hypothetical protein
MQTVVAIFGSSGSACEAVAALGRAGIARDRVSVLMPGTPERDVERRVPTDQGEPPGMGAALGGVVGGALGLSTAALVLPGIGPIVVAGLLAAGVAGAAGGAVVGDRVEDRLSNGVPRDEQPIYEAALGRGRSVVVAGVEDDEEAERARAAFRAAGAESVDAARDRWLTGLEAEETEAKAQ